jgi:L-glyceraldehyde 3-phosphate reductase
VTSVLVGASSVRQLEQNIAAMDNLEFSAEELSEIDQYALEAGIDLWRSQILSWGQAHDGAYPEGFTAG